RREGSDETALSGIQFFSQSADGTQWHIDSSSGLFFEEANELFLRDGVRILEATRNGTINTESMWLLIDEKRATGDRDVVLTAPGSRTLGTGFELDLVRDKATLKGRVKTDYE
ncbi:LPS export ABC transporter periplasmic protein LptC, partial [Luminiphilus sp.]|nr:LPS export ABC transporter periplasmic protein LptC [Luminiphilus sp.]